MMHISDRRLGIDLSAWLQNGSFSRAILITFFTLSHPGIGLSQFSGGGGLFDNTLNQALPRVAVPSNQNPAGGWPQPTSTASGFSGSNPRTFSNNGTFSNNSTFSNSNGPAFASGGTNVPRSGAGATNTSQLPKDWKFGVAVDPSQTGAIVRQVTPNSPAQRAGLKPNDIIIALGGVQVGYVENRLNDVGDQIRRSADNTGRVRALVLDSQSARLQNMDIQLDSASNALTGSIALRDRGSLPPNSIMTVQIENVTRPFYEVRNGKVITSAFGTGPFFYEIQYDPVYIDPRDRYQLNAIITDQTGRTLYALREPIPIPTGGLPPNSVLALDSFRDLQLAGQQAGGGTVTSAYGQDPAVLSQIFMQLLGRPPSTNEQVAWSGYLAQGNSIIDLKAKIIGSPSYYDRLGNNPQAFIQTMIRTLKGSPATQNEVNAWLNRLQQYQGNREQVAKEFMQQLR